MTDVSVPILSAGENGAVAALTSPHIRMRQSPIEPDALADHVAAAARQIADTIEFD